MTVNMIAAASKLRFLERQFEKILSVTPDHRISDDVEFIEWTKDVTTTLKIVHPLNAELIIDFENSCREIDKSDKHRTIILGILRRARNVLELESNDETDRTLTEAIKYALSEIYLKSWMIRGSAALLVISAGLFLGGVFQIKGYQVDIKKEADSARNDIRMHGQSIKTSMNERRDGVIGQIKKLEVDAQKLSTILKDQHNDLEQEVTKLRQELEMRFKEIESQMLNRLKSFDRILITEKQAISRISGDYIDKRIPNYVNLEMARISGAVTNSIEVSMPERIEGEFDRIEKTIDDSIKHDLSERLDEQSKRIEQFANKLITNEIPLIFKTEVNKLGAASTEFIVGPLSKQVELEKKMISESVSKFLLESLTAHVELEKERITTESDQFRKSLWTQLATKLDRLFSGVIAKENARINTLSKEIQMLRFEVDDLQRN